MLRSIWSCAWWSVSSTFDFDVEPYAHFCVVARPQDQTVLTLSDMTMSSVCDYGGRKALRQRSSISLVWKYQKFVQLINVVIIARKHWHESSTVNWCDKTTTFLDSPVRYALLVISFSSLKLWHSSNMVSAFQIRCHHIIVIVLIFSSCYCCNTTTGCLQLVSARWC